jgi:hypothetical protein
MTPNKLTLAFALMAYGAVHSDEARGEELRDAPFWATLQNLNALVPQNADNRQMGVIFVKLDVPTFTWLPFLSERQSHSVLWFKVEGPKHTYGGLFLSALNSEQVPFFFPVDPEINLLCSDIEGAVQSVEVLDKVGEFILTFCKRS